VPTFDTPRPISATIEVALGDVRISAAGDDVTVVTVQPSDPSSDKDRKAAEQTSVEYANERLLVKGPRARSWFSRGGSIDVVIELPAGSSVNGAAEGADFSTTGRLGTCRIKSGLGRISLDSADVVRLKTGVGDITVDHATGHTDVTTGSGEMHLGELDGTAVVKNANGDTWIGAARSDLRVQAANGDITVGHAHASVVAKSANGDVRLGEIARGSVVLETKMGDVDVGIREGVTAWLDVHATAGHVRNSLDAADPPVKPAETVELRARTSVGEIVIRRSDSSQLHPAEDNQ
jgi:Putative adhesin